MKLKLKNFRCYEDSKFDFGNDGLTLISGSSGKGKSTLMMAIEFALFGTGSKLQTYGKRSCSVELEISPDFKIVRQKCPNRLIINDIYEDDAGESMIKSRFGANILSCYIPQNIRKTFVLMTPAERLDFLESLVLTNVNIQDIKTKSKQLIKKLGDEHNESIGSLKVITETLSTIVKPEVVSFPLKVSKENYEKAMNNERVRTKNSGILIKRNEKKLERLTNELSEQKVQFSILAEKQAHLKQLEETLESTKSETFNERKLIELQKKLKQMAAMYKFIEKDESYKKAIRQLEEMKDEELRELQDTISKTSIWESLSKEDATVQLTLWNDEVRKLDRKRLIQAKVSNFRNLSPLKDSLSVELETATTDLEAAEKLISDLEFQQTTHTCPKCSSQLRFEYGKLIQVTQIVSEVNGDIDTLRKSVNTLKNKTASLRKKLCETEAAIVSHKIDISNLNELQDVNDASEEECENMRNYIHENSEAELSLEKMKSRLATKTYSHVIVSLETKTNRLKKELDAVHMSYVMYDETEDTIRAQLSEQEVLKDRSTRSLEQKTQITNQISKISADCEAIKKKYSNSRAVVDIEAEIMMCKDELTEHKEKLVISTRILDKIVKYNEYVEKHSVWDRINTQYLTLTEKEKNLRSRFSSACVFRDKILEAESIAITNTINTINTHAQFYLDTFFTDDPITIRLVAFKETKDSQKPQINLEIEYKGIEHDLNMLSGGEMSRVVLAFTLALSEIHNTPFVMLDESTSSLDQELTGSVVDGLKENFGNKLVLLIAHQVVQGSFDKIVKL